MTGINLLKKIKQGLYPNGSQFILKNNESNLNNTIISLDNYLLYNDLFGQKEPLSSAEILNSNFYECIDKDNLYNKAIYRLKNTKRIKDETDAYNAIVYLEKEIDYYRSQIKKLETYICNDKK